MRAVVIESRPEVVAELKDVFAEFGIEVVLWSQKGSSWSQAFREARPDFVFIDYLVSGRSGLKCLEMAVEITNTPFYFFMHSFRGLRANALEEKAVTAGADVVMSKPIVKERLRAAITRLLRLKEISAQRKTMLVLRES
jgi:DNA-binding response OmpR family regulator